MKVLLLILLSILPVFLVGYFVYKKDKNKEPTSVLVKLFLGGLLSVVLTLIITGVIYTIFPFFSIEKNELNLIELFFSVFFGVALIEEISKFTFLYLFSYNEKNFDEFYDMILYAVFVALGFAGFENVLYVIENGIDSFGAGLGVGLFRALSAVPGHAWDGVFMGYYLGLAKISSINNNKQLERKNKILAVVVPTILHGIYDFCLFTGSWFFIGIFFIFLIGVYILAIKKINLISSIKGKIKYKNSYCPNCGTRVESDYCPECGGKNE